MNFIKTVPNLLDILQDVKNVNQSIIKNGVIKKQKQKRRLNEKSVAVVENLKVMIFSLKKREALIDTKVIVKSV